MVKWLPSFLSCLGSLQLQDTEKRDCLTNEKLRVTPLRNGLLARQGLQTTREALTYAQLASRYSSSNHGVIVLAWRPPVRSARSCTPRCVSVYCNKAAVKALGATERAHAANLEDVVLPLLESAEPHLLADLQAHLRRFARSEPAGALTLYFNAQKYDVTTSCNQQQYMVNSKDDKINGVLNTSVAISSGMAPDVFCTTHTRCNTAPNGVDDFITDSSGFTSGGRCWRHAVVEPVRFLASAGDTAGSTCPSPSNQSRVNCWAPGAANRFVHRWELHDVQSSGTGKAQGVTHAWPALLVTLEGIHSGSPSAGIRTDRPYCGLDVALFQTLADRSLVGKADQVAEAQCAAKKTGAHGADANDRSLGQSFRRGAPREGDSTAASTLAIMERSGSSFFAGLQTRSSVACMPEKRGPWGCGVNQATAAATTAAVGASAADAAEDVRLREGMVLAGLTSIMTAVTADGKGVLYQNAMSVLYYGARAATATRVNNAAAEAILQGGDGLAGGDILTELFCLEPVKLDRMFTEVCVEGRVWKGIVQVPASCHPVLSSLARHAIGNITNHGLVAEPPQQLLARELPVPVDGAAMLPPPAMLPWTSHPPARASAGVGPIATKPAQEPLANPAAPPASVAAGQKGTAAGSSWGGQISPDSSVRAPKQSAFTGAGMASISARPSAAMERPAADAVCAEPSSVGARARRYDRSSLDLALTEGLWPSALQAAMSSTVDAMSNLETGDPFQLLSAMVTTDPLATSTWGLLMDTPEIPNPNPNLTADSLRRSKTHAAATCKRREAARSPLSPNNTSTTGPAVASSAHIAIPITEDRPPVCPELLLSGFLNLPADTSRGAAPQIPHAPVRRQDTVRRALGHLRRRSELDVSYQGRYAYTASSGVGILDGTADRLSLAAVHERDGGERPGSHNDGSGSDEEPDVLAMPMPALLESPQERVAAAVRDRGEALQVQRRTASVSFLRFDQGTPSIGSPGGGSDQTDLPQQPNGSGRAWMAANSGSAAFSRACQNRPPRRCLTRNDLVGSSRNMSRVVAFASSLRNTPGSVQQALQLAVAANVSVSSQKAPDSAGSPATTSVGRARTMTGGSLLPSSLGCPAVPDGDLSLRQGSLESIGSRAFLDGLSGCPTDAGANSAVARLRVAALTGSPGSSPAAGNNDSNRGASVAAVRDSVELSPNGANAVSPLEVLSRSSSSRPAGIRQTRVLPFPAAKAAVPAAAGFFDSAKGILFRKPSRSFDNGTRLWRSRSASRHRLYVTDDSTSIPEAPETASRARPLGEQCAPLTGTVPAEEGAADVADHTLKCLLTIDEAVVPKSVILHEILAAEPPGDSPAAFSGITLDGGGPAPVVPKETPVVPFPALAGRGPFCWHEVSASRTTDPVTGEYAIILTQVDVTAKVEAERHLAYVTEAEHRLLEQIFPRHVLAYMTEEGGPWATLPDNGPGAADAPVIRDINKLATSHNQVTLLFADIQGFTPMCKVLEPRVVMAFLNELFTLFDEMLDEFGVYKVETIGDCYFVAGGLIQQDEEGMSAVRARDSHADPLHAERVFGFAKAMLAAAAGVRLPTTGGPVRLRIGIHSGPVVSGVVGQRMPRFCLFGDTVNTTSRMESTGVPGCIHASEAARSLLTQDKWLPTGGIEVKGKGLMNTFLWVPPDADCKPCEALHQLDRELR